MAFWMLMGLGLERKVCFSPNNSHFFQRYLCQIWFNKRFRMLLFVLAIYLFLLSIKVMGGGFKGMGSGFSEELLKTVDNPLAALFVGILATSIVQSSSTTTSITVAMVAGNTIGIENAIPIVIGANIGTTVTNLIVSLGHIRRTVEFERALSAAVVHDIFNLMAASLLFPVELLTRHFFGTGLIEYLASSLSRTFYGTAGASLAKPLDFILKPPEEFILDLVPAWAAIVLALGLLFLSLKIICDSMHLIMDARIQTILDKYLFKTAGTSFLFGMILTAIIQSSSVTTSLMVPLVGGGILTIEQIFPYTIGANIGTTVTAILAALATDNEDGLTVAFAHLMFNSLGIITIYPFKRIPIRLAKKIGKFVVEHRDFAVLYIVVAFYVIPAAFIFIPRMLG
jgi:solute carrier family 34 (sodium-dependent phosphate cotransporter)